MSIEQTLSDCGLNHSERKVLAFLIEKGSRGASLIAKGTDIKRPTVYAVLENLISIGVVTKNNTAGTAQYRSVNPEQIPLIFTKRAEQDYSKLKNAAKQLKGDIERAKLRGLETSVDYSVLHYDNSEASFIQHFEISFAGEFCAIFDPQFAINPHCKNAVARFLEVTGRKRSRLREIAVAGSRTDWYLGQIKNKNHIVKLVSPKTKLPTNMIIRSSGEVILTSYAEQGMSSIVINSRDYHTSMMSVFEMLWASL